MYELKINNFFLIMKQFFYSSETKNYYKKKIILIFIFNTTQISTLFYFNFFNLLFDHDFLCLFLEIVFKLKEPKKNFIFYKNKDI